MKIERTHNQRMLLGNCLRRISKIQYTKCFTNSTATTKRFHVIVSQSLPTSSLTANATVFTNHIQNCGDHHPHFVRRHGHRHYSSRKNNANAQNDYSDNEDDDNIANWSRKLPKFDGFYRRTPSIYLMVKNTLSALLIRSYFDQQFNRQEFLDGAKQAVQVHARIYTYISKRSTN